MLYNLQNAVRIYCCIVIYTYENKTDEKENAQEA